jgi:signal transduction histidine kinase
VFIGSLALGILLIRSVLQEVKLRERMEKLAVDLEVANADLKRLDEAKSDFISIASHQLRTPLSIIKGYISMMREGTFGQLADRVRDPLEKVYVSNERLINLVNDLLDLSRMERGRMQFDMKAMHLNDIVEPMVTDFQIVAKNKKMELIWQKDFKSDAISGDTNKIRQIILNLIDNAFKYTPSGSVTVRLAQEGDAIRFTVTDTGPGLSEEESRKLFQKFVRGKEQKAAHTEGLGLGLYVAKLIAEAHGGSIGATSPGKGKGSTFFLLLPLEQKKS